VCLGCCEAQVLHAFLLHAQWVHASPSPKNSLRRSGGTTHPRGKDIQSRLGGAGKVGRVMVVASQPQSQKDPAQTLIPDLQTTDLPSQYAKRGLRGREASWEALKNPGTSLIRIH
jgi:hypothetical protein